MESSELVNGQGSEPKAAAGSPKPRVKPAFDKLLAEAKSVRCEASKKVDLQKVVVEASEAIGMASKSMAAKLDPVNFTAGFRTKAAVELKGTLSLIGKAKKRLQEAQDLLAAVDSAIAAAVAERETSKADQALKLAKRNLGYIERVAVGTKTRLGLHRLREDVSERHEKLIQEIQAFVEKNNVANDEDKECANALRREVGVLAREPKWVGSPCMKKFVEDVNEDAVLFGIDPEGVDIGTAASFLRSLGQEVKGVKDDSEALDMTAASFLALLCDFGKWTLLMPQTESRQEAVAKHLDSFAGEPPSPDMIQKRVASLEPKVLRNVMTEILELICRVSQKHCTETKLPFGWESIGLRKSEFGAFRELIPAVQQHGDEPIFLVDSLKLQPWESKCEERPDQFIAHAPHCRKHSRTVESSHGFVTLCDFFMTTDLSELGDCVQWNGMKAAVCAVKKIIPNNTNKKVITEVRHYATSMEDIKVAAYAIRCRWLVEEMLALL
jgi:hypothetical protein